MKIKDIIIKNGLFLAPMAGATDLAMRIICKKFGAEYMTTEMISSNALYYNDKKTLSLAKIHPSTLPTAVQIFGSDPDMMALAAKKIYEISSPKPSAIDINMGCPMRKIISNGDGSALMKKPVLAGKIIEAVVRSSYVPVTVKIRTGFDSSSINAPEIARIAELSGAAAVCVHGRTREQLYSPGVDYNTIAKVKSAVSIPVIANGDIDSAKKAIDVLSFTGCDGIAIGRGALGNPFIFDEIACAIENRPYFPPSDKTKIETALSQLDLMLDDKGEHIGVLEARSAMSYYTKAICGGAEARRQINMAKSKQEIQIALLALLK